MSEAGDYLLGTGDDELARLAFQHRVWAREAFSLWDLAGFGFGHTIVDLGCGPGFTSVDLAHLVGARGEVIAVDQSERFLDHLRRLLRAGGLRNVRPLRRDARDLGLPDASVDGVYCRWLLCYLERPGEVVGEVARCLRPGGVFAATDYFNYRAFTLAPRSAIFDRVVAAVETAWRRRGGDLAVQGRLPGLLRAAGLELLHVRQQARIARPGTPLWHWPESFFRGFLPTLEEMGLVTPDERLAFEAEWRERSHDPDTFVCIPPMFDLVAGRREER